MSLMNALIEALDVEVRRLAPSTEVAKRIYPQSCDKSADLFTDVCFEIADLHGAPAGNIAQQLVDRLSAVSPFSFQAGGDGFINISGPDTAGWLLQVHPVAAPLTGLRQGILLPYPTNTFEGWSFARLAARAFLQTRLFNSLGGEAWLQFGGERIDGLVEMARSLRTVDEGAVVEQQAGAGFVSGVEEILTGSTDRVQVWLTENALPPTIYDGLSTLRRCHPGRVTVAVASQSWGARVVDWPAIESFADRSLEQMEALLLYLAGPLPAQELDPAVPESAEVENIVWYLAASLERLNQIVPPSEGEVLRESFEIPPLYRRLLRPFALLPNTAANAARCGDLPLLLSQISSGLTELNRLLNRADIRCQLTGPKMEILSGLWYLLSDKMAKDVFHCLYLNKSCSRCESRISATGSCV